MARDGTIAVGVDTGKLVDVNATTRQDGTTVYADRVQQVTSSGDVAEQPPFLEMLEEMREQTRLLHLIVELLHAL